MTPLPAALEVHPDHGMIGIYGSQLDVFDDPAFTDPQAVLVAIDYAAYLRTNTTTDTLVNASGTLTPGGLGKIDPVRGVVV
ncbi:hypothetical protein AB0F91_43835 [Amycolatopsis sp. NPDC023774]|uniref:hypothetical protein n=1 Tax=Amycolatopsis sp. NPDC023774 TaxID=3155015 RepID=UPI0034049854